MIQVTDPVCGVEIDLGAAVAHAEYQAWAYFFCSEKCHRAFTEVPDRYAKKPDPLFSDTSLTQREERRF